MRRAQQGLGLVEMMIAIAISLALAVGMLRMLINVRSTNQSQNNTAQQQDDQRLALLRMTDTIQHAGYFPNPTTSSVSAEFAAASSSSPAFAFNAGQTLTGSTGTGVSTDSITARSDTVTVRYESAPGDGVLDCSGKVNSGASNLVMINTFALDSASNLNCQVTTVVGGTATTTTQSIASNLSNFSVLYGVDTSGSNSVTRYMSAASINAVTPATLKASYWAGVRSLRLTLTFNNPLNGQPGQSATLTPITQTIPVFNALP